jgi:alkylation response protein AidB-like acyl-CoA dehydrogenase
MSGIMNHETALSKAKEIADRVLAPAARQNDKEGRFSSEAVEVLGRASLLGVMLPAEVGGSGLGPRTFANVYRLCKPMAPSGWMLVCC